MEQILLDVKGLKKYFPITKGLVFMKVKGWVKAIDGIDFVIKKGEAFSLVGESGCGKTTTARTILLLERPTGGHIYFGGKDITKLTKNELVQYRRSLQAVFQDPSSSLNPRMRVEEIISEPMIASNSPPRSVVKERVAEVMIQVGLNPVSTSFYPHEFSGGQRQRIALARALITDPQCIILDEPVSALDVSIRAQILNLLKDIQDKLGLTYLMISHDLAAVKYLSNRIGVMYLGKLVETAMNRELYINPLHPYTKALLSAALPSHPDAKRIQIIIRGEVPNPLNLPSGCQFHSRCLHSIPLCSEVEPNLKEVENDHMVACHLYSH